MAFKIDVVDLSVHNTVTDFNLVRASGVRGIIHKATEGTNFVDRKYAERRKAAREAGLLWGAYHFANNSNVAAQVDHFLRVSQWDADTLLCLDWEDNRYGTMSLDQVKEFLQLVYEKTGQRPVIYSGNTIKREMRGRPDPFLNKHRLWLAQYASRAMLPPGFSSYWLWQFSGDGFGGFGNVPGIPTKGIDCNMFGGADIEAEWAQKPMAPAVPVAMASAFAIPAADGPAGYDPDSVTKAPMVKTAATSKSAWALILAFLGWLADRGSDIINGLLGSLQDVVKDVGENLGSLEMVVGWFKGNWQGMVGWIVCVLLIVAFVRHVDLKRIFLGQNEETKP